MLTEFGLCKTESETGIGINCSVFMDLADDWLQSWIDWDYSDGMWYRNGQLQTGRQKEYSRPYARATAGLPTKMKFDATTRHFDFTYKPNRCAFSACFRSRPLDVSDVNN
jgi:endoglycosylceramidase